MSYQDTILRRYREVFPTKTLKHISSETGIQMTRVFRLFNGFEMKLKEYEAFERALQKGAMMKSKRELLCKFKDYIDSVSEKNLALFEIEMNHVLKVDEFLSRSIIENNKHITAS